MAALCNGAQVFRQGDAGDSFYVVEEGTFSITNEAGEEVAKCGKGQCFGELALLRQEARWVCGRGMHCGVECIDVRSGKRGRAGACIVMGSKSVQRLGRLLHGMGRGWLSGPTPLA